MSSADDYKIIPFFISKIYISNNISSAHLVNDYWNHLKPRAKNDILK